MQAQTFAGLFLVFPGILWSSAQNPRECRAMAAFSRAKAYPDTPGKSLPPICSSLDSWSMICPFVFSANYSVRIEKQL